MQRHTSPRRCKKQVGLKSGVSGPTVHVRARTLTWSGVALVAVAGKILAPTSADSTSGAHGAAPHQARGPRSDVSGGPSNILGATLKTPALAWARPLLPQRLAWGDKSVDLSVVQAHKIDWIDPASSPALAWGAAAVRGEGSAARPDLTFPSAVSSRTSKLVWPGKQGHLQPPKTSLSRDASAVLQVEAARRRMDARMVEEKRLLDAQARAAEGEIRQKEALVEQRSVVKARQQRELLHGQDTLRQALEQDDHLSSAPPPAHSAEAGRQGRRQHTGATHTGGRVSGAHALLTLEQALDADARLSHPPAAARRAQDTAAGAAVAGSRAKRHSLESRQAQAARAGGSSLWKYADRADGESADAEQLRQHRSRLSDRVPAPSSDCLPPHAVSAVRTASCPRAGGHRVSRR